MPDLCLFFQVHQPGRLLPADRSTPKGTLRREDDASNAAILSGVAERCYLPANEMFQRLIREHEGRFCMALSLSGTVLDQMERHRPDALESFQRLVAAGNVELIAETYYHSLAFLVSGKEFERQVELHLRKLERLFHVRPRVFRNTEMIYHDDIAARAETLGFEGILAEGTEATLKSDPPTVLFRPTHTARIKTLLRHTGLSDDIGFRFSDPSWIDHPLTAGKFAKWMSTCPGDLVNVFMGYEAIGEHQRKGSGIFRFFEALPDAVDQAGLQWVTPCNAVQLYPARREFHCPHLTSWTDSERDLSAWIGNTMQRECLDRLATLETAVLAASDPEILDVWASLQTSNHFHWMSTKGGKSGASHSPLSPYRNADDAHARHLAAVSALENALC